MSPRNPTAPARRPPHRQDELRALLHTLNLSRMAATCADVALKAAKEGLTHEAFLYELARQECEHRTQQRIARRRRQSGLPAEKTFRTLRLDRFPPVAQLAIEHLRTGAFVEEAINVVAVGRPGVGKSHVAAAVGDELIVRDHTVLWSTTAALVQRLLAAKRDLRLPQELAKLDRFACLILDDIGYVQHDRDEMEVLFTLLAERYERRSVMITTNLVFSEWERIFKDPMTTLAAIDRVVHHSVILDLMAVESYRAQEAHQQQVAPPDEAARDPTQRPLRGEKGGKGAPHPEEQGAPHPEEQEGGADRGKIEPRNEVLQVVVTDTHKEGTTDEQKGRHA